MAQALDYSAGFPGAQAIKDAGYIGAIRYIGFPDRRKCTTADEVQDFRAHGGAMALVYEDTLTTWRGGHSAGVTAARQARDHTRSIGIPDSVPIYMAIDQDVVTAQEFAVMLDYLRGAGSVLGGPGLTGVYGEADVIDRARDAGVARWFWQTAAWSRGRKTTAHIYQHVGTVYVGEIACDVNDVMADNWGQYGGEDDDMKADEFVVDPHTGTQVGKFNDVTFETNRAAWMAVDTANQLKTQLAAVQGALAAGDAAILAAVSTINADGPVTDEQVAVLAERLGVVLPEGIAQALGQKLIGHTEEVPTT